MLTLLRWECNGLPNDLGYCLFVCTSGHNESYVFSAFLVVTFQRASTGKKRLLHVWRAVGPALLLAVYSKLPVM